jgi:hypothetical protein
MEDLDGTKLFRKVFEIIREDGLTKHEMRQFFAQSYIACAAEAKISIRDALQEMREEWDHMHES